MNDTVAAGPTAEPAADRPLVVVVAVLTYRRNDALAALLPLLVDQCRQLDRGGRTSSSVLIVDNDAGRGAEPIVTSVGPAARYVHEAVPGIAAGRARAVDEAERADLLVFVDDDEVPSPGWLLGLWTAWLTFERPAGVVGRVTPTFHGTSDPWIDAGGFFVRPQRATGSLVRAASSANLLLDLAVLRRHGLTFDRRLGLAGGEDTMLTRQLTESGERLVWCHEAQVIDVIPPSRMRRRWVLKRAFSHGAVESRVSLRLAAGNRFPHRLRLLLEGAGRLIAGGVLAAAGTILRRLAWQARGARLACRGAGLLVGATGRTVAEYTRENGSGR